MNYMPSVRAASEKKLGLLHFSSPQNHGWHGDVRKRYVTAGAAWPRLMAHLAGPWSFCSYPLGHHLTANMKLTVGRFTDFLVNEIQKNGEVLHLSDYTLGSRPKDTVSFSVLGQLFFPAGNKGLTAIQDVHVPGQFHQRPQQSVTPTPTSDAPASDASPLQVSDEDLKILGSLLDESTTQALKELFERIGASGTSRLDPRANSVKFPPMERSQRGKIHQVRLKYSNTHHSANNCLGNPSHLPVTDRNGNWQRWDNHCRSFQSLHQEPSCRWPTPPL